MLRITLVACILATAAVHGQNPDIQQSIIDIFGDPTKQTATTTISPNNVFVPTTAPTTGVLDDGSACLCVPYYLCDPTTNSIKKDGSIDGFGVIDIRFNAPTRKCADSLDVCCKEDKQTVDPITPKPPINKPTGCGIRNTNGIDFAITGNTNHESQFGEFPWTVALLSNSDDKCTCGGSIIHPQVILTGAVCVHKNTPSEIRIRAGEWDTQTTKERLPYQERQVLRIILHPEFKLTTVANDMALLVLAEPLVLADHIQPICLPNQDYVTSDNHCFATGWGKDKFGQKGNYQVIMKKIELPTVQFGECQAALRRTRLGKRFNLHHSFMCAGGQEGQDTCEGDGGAPLACPIPGLDDRYQQSGIVAWGIGCGDAIPAVYANVASFRNWVDGHMNNLGYGTSSYTP